MKTEHSVLKVILHTVKQNKRICMTLFASVLGSAGFALLPPLILAKAIDCLYVWPGLSFSSGSVLFRAASINKYCHIPT